MQREDFDSRSWPGTTPLTLEQEIERKLAFLRGLQPGKILHIREKYFRGARGVTVRVSAKGDYVFLPDGSTLSFGYIARDYNIEEFDPVYDWQQR